MQPECEGDLVSFTETGHHQFTRFAWFYSDKLTLFNEVRGSNGGAHKANPKVGVKLMCFFFWRTEAKFHPQLGRRNHHNRSLELQIARHCYWMRFKVPRCIQWHRNFCQILLPVAVFLLVFYCFDSFLKSFCHLRLKLLWDLCHSF
jgi:hypothetical protein